MIFDFFRGACATRQFGDGGVRFSLGPLKTEGKRWEKIRRTKENEETSWRKIVESCEEIIALEESVEKPRKLEETFGKRRQL